MAFRERCFTKVIRVCVRAPLKPGREKGVSKRPGEIKRTKSASTVLSRVLCPLRRIRVCPLKLSGSSNIEEHYGPAGFRLCCKKACFPLQ